jgi:4'-phosphopantetheinyl transferase
MEALQHKYLSPPEQLLFDNNPKLLTMAWSAKEAAYKWQGRRGVEFADHMIIQKIEQIEDYYNINIFMNLTQPKMQINTQGIVKQDFTCAFVVHNEVFHPFDK